MTSSQVEENNHSDLLGYYNPAFFDMYLNTERDEVFVHEYTHYIQNISTVHGLIHFAYKKIYWLEKFIGCTHPLYNEIQNLCHQKKSLMDHMSEAIGNVKNYPYKSIVVENVNLLWNYKYKEKYDVEILKSVTLDLKVDGDKKSIVFGYKIIKENMARIMQNHFYPINNPSKSTTYYIVEDVVKSYHPNFPINPQNLFALCDIALLFTSDSTQMFFKLLDFCKENNKEYHIKDGTITVTKKIKAA